MKPHLILINPWIYDFAAYDFWSKPLGLLAIAGFLRNKGFLIHLIDCLDIHHPGMPGSRALIRLARRAYGTGKFFRERVPKPAALNNIPRSYSRYGMSKQCFIEELKAVERPSAILVTSLMTYWYPGVLEAVRAAKEIHPRTPVLLGGIYAKLCTDHALRISEADEVVTSLNLLDFSALPDILQRFGIKAIPAPNPPHPYPAFDLLHGIDYVCLQTSLGCPFRCRYCASPFLNPRILKKDPLQILEEIFYWNTNWGVKDYAFYDDALLMEFDSHLKVLLEKVMKQNRLMRFHTPNALHVRKITSSVAKLLYASGFQTIRLGLETSDMGLHLALDGKVSPGEFEKAVKNLAGAGFSKKEIGVYILAGLPDQSPESVEESVRYVDKAGATPYLAEYSPIPHTPLWRRALACSEYDLAAEPLYQNNTLLPCWNPDQRKRFADIKKEVIEIRRRSD
ncbi:MAG: radical SAM protein [Deltaproteobacteria bacterium]|nr:radical SAM protein [Deltaproteobacteria bacterium]